MAAPPPVRVPLVDLRARHDRVKAAAEAGVLAVLRSGQVIGGPVLAELESRLAARNGKAFAIGVNSGTDALRLALQALDLGPGDEVILPAFSFFATLESVLQTGASAVIVDVLPDRPLLDPTAVASAVGPRSRAVVPVHLFGSAAPAQVVDLPVVDDAAQAVVGGAGRMAGALSAVSFYPTKVLGAAGDGGLVLTDSPELAARVRRLANHGMHPGERFEPVGAQLAGNSRLDAVQAALLLAHLDALDARLAARRALARQLDAVLGSLALPYDAEGPVSVYALRHPERDRIAQALAARGVASRVYYPYTLAELAPRFPRVRAHACPAAASFRDELLAIPCHAELDPAQVEHLLASLQEVLP